MLPEIERQQQHGKEAVFRADAAAKPELYEALEGRDVKYAIRLPANDNLERLLTRPVGSPSYDRWGHTRDSAVYPHDAVESATAADMSGVIDLTAGVYREYGFIFTAGEEVPSLSRSAITPHRTLGSSCRVRSTGR